MKRNCGARRPTELSRIGFLELDWMGSGLFERAWRGWEGDVSTAPARPAAFRFERWFLPINYWKEPFFALVFSWIVLTLRSHGLDLRWQRGEDKDLGRLRDVLLWFSLERNFVRADCSRLSIDILLSSSLDSWDHLISWREPVFLLNDLQTFRFHPKYHTRAPYLLQLIENQTG